MFFQHLSFLLTAACLAFQSLQALSLDQINSELTFLSSLGSRVTGSKQHNQLIDHIEARIRQIGLRPQSDHYSFDSLTNVPNEEVLLIFNGTKHDIASIYPYSGNTPADGIHAPLVLVNGIVPNWSSVKDKIVVVGLSNPSLPLSALVEVWNPFQAWGDVRNPLVPAMLAGGSLTKAKQAGAKGVIFAWDSTISAANAEKQYIPFTEPFVGLPAVFTSSNTSVSIVQAARKGLNATLTLNAPIIPNTQTRTVYTEVVGRVKPEETILVVTHTDGSNLVEENGHIGMFQLMEDVVASPPNRTHVFIFTTGHLRIPAFTETGQATTRFLDDHPELWRGRKNERKAVVGMVVEHLGAMQYLDRVPGHGKSTTLYKTGNVEPELLYANTAELARMASAAWKGSDPNKNRISRPSAFIQFGEGSTLTDKKIPNLSLVTLPVYLLSEAEYVQGIDVIDLQTLQRQIASFQTMRRQFDRTEIVSFGVVGTKSILGFGESIVNALLSLGGFVLRKIFTLDFS